MVHEPAPGPRSKPALLRGVVLADQSLEHGPAMFRGVEEVRDFQEKDRPAANVLEGDTRLNASLSRMVLARHGIGPLSVPKVLPTGARLPGSINLGFADGHAGPIPNERLWDLTWHKNRTSGVQRPQ